MCPLSKWRPPFKGCKMAPPMKGWRVVPIVASESGTPPQREIILLSFFFWKSDAYFLMLGKVAPSLWNRKWRPLPVFWCRVSHLSSFLSKVAHPLKNWHFVPLVKRPFLIFWDEDGASFFWDEDGAPRRCQVAPLIKIWRLSFLFLAPPLEKLGKRRYTFGTTPGYLLKNITSTRNYRRHEF